MGRNKIVICLIFKPEVTKLFKLCMWIDRLSLNFRLQLITSSQVTLHSQN